MSALAARVVQRFEGGAALVDRVARRFEAGRLPVKQLIIQYVKDEGGEADYDDVMWKVRHRDSHKALRSLIKGGYLSEFEGTDEDGESIKMVKLEKEPDYLATGGGKISKAKFEAWLKRKGWPMPSYEAFGRSVHAFWFKNPPGMSREEMESELRMVGGRVSPEYNRGRPGTSITNISYFKAWHWDE